MSEDLDPQGAAIGWLVELRSGESTAADHEAFAAWLNAHPAHGEAWRRLTGAVDHTFSSSISVPLGGAARAVDHTLGRASTLARQRRRVLRGALGLAGLGVAVGWGTYKHGLMPDLMADFHTTTAERRTFSLWSGGSLLLDARSSVDLDRSGNVQEVVLRTGQLIATHRTPGRAALVLRHAQVRAEMGQGRCLLQEDKGRTLVCPLDGEATVTQATGGSGFRKVLQPGQAVLFDQDGTQLSVPAADVPLLAAWERGVLAVRDSRLGEVVARLQPYQHRLLRITDDAAALRISGAYPLDDTDAALQALAETLPITVRRYAGGWLVRIERSA